jgi:hypothetical protein
MNCRKIGLTFTSGNRVKDLECIQDGATSPLIDELERVVSARQVAGTEHRHLRDPRKVCGLKVQMLFELAV